MRGLLSRQISRNEPSHRCETAATNFFMLRNFKPMLAASKPRDYTDEMFYSRIQFPVIATPKIDGIRCVTRDMPRPPEYLCEPLARSLKGIPNEWIRYKIGTECPPGLDGELVTYRSRDLFSNETLNSFNQIQSDVMSYSGKPVFKYLVFDCEIEKGAVYQHRVELLKSYFNGDGKQLPSFCQQVEYTWIDTLDQLIEYEAKQVEAGYEGICFRDPNSPYKYGRSTLREGWLVKMKRFVTEEAVIIGSYEEMANNNPMSIGLTGHAQRTTHKANMTGKMRLGGFECVLKKVADELRAGDDISEKHIFGVGSGFDAEDRQRYWKERESLVGKTITIKHMPHGAKDVPRLPIFVGFRATEDL